MRVVTLILILSVAPMAVSAQQRAPLGDPDLQGIWSNQTPIPLERPPALADKATFTEAEAAEVERTALEEILKTVARAVPLSGELNEIWLETQNGKVSQCRHTSLVIDPPDGRIPFTPEGRTRWDATPSIEGQLLGRPMAANRPEAARSTSAASRPAGSTCPILSTTTITTSCRLLATLLPE